MSKFSFTSLFAFLIGIPLGILAAIFVHSHFLNNGPTANEQAGYGRAKAFLQASDYAKANGCKLTDESVPGNWEYNVDCRNVKPILFPKIQHWHR